MGAVPAEIPCAAIQTLNGNEESKTLKHYFVQHGAIPLLEKKQSAGRGTGWEVPGEGSSFAAAMLHHEKSRRWRSLLDPIFLFLRN